MLPTVSLSARPDLNDIQIDFLGSGYARTEQVYAGGLVEFEFTQYPKRPIPELVRYAPIDIGPGGATRPP